MLDGSDDLRLPDFGDDDPVSVRGLFVTARGPRTLEELANEGILLTAMAQAMAQPALTDLDVARQRRSRRTIVGRVAIVAGSLFLGTSDPPARRTTTRRRCETFGLRLQLLD